MFFFSHSARFLQFAITRNAQEIPGASSATPRLVVLGRDSSRSRPLPSIPHVCGYGVKEGTRELAGKNIFSAESNFVTVPYDPDIKGEGGHSPGH